MSSVVWTTRRWPLGNGGARLQWRKHVPGTRCHLAVSVRRRSHKPLKVHLQSHRFLTTDPFLRPVRFIRVRSPYPQCLRGYTLIAPGVTD